MAEGLLELKPLAVKRMDYMRDTLAGRLSELAGAEKPVQLMDGRKGAEPLPQVGVDIVLAILWTQTDAPASAGAEKLKMVQSLVRSDILA